MVSENKPLKVYVAGKFEKKLIVLNLYERLKSMGHEISYDWTNHIEIKPYSENVRLATTYSDSELEGISNSDVFIYLSDNEGTTLKMEVGAAIMAKMITGSPKQIYIVGEYNDKSPWFMNEKFVKRLDNIDDVIKDIERYADASR
ncbi:MAG TPA: hypothetical protein PLX15_00640 [Candidatus Woesearchaeota archaeon]|nr:hypothetical protein [Candidatus Woesearchaeota archaeon]